LLQKLICFFWLQSCHHLWSLIVIYNRYSHHLGATHVNILANAYAHTGRYFSKIIEL
jgi:hypothetical protein